MCCFSVLGEAGVGGMAVTHTHAKYRGQRSETAEQTPPILSPFSLFSQ